MAGFSCIIAIVQQGSGASFTQVIAKISDYSRLQTPGKKRFGGKRIKLRPFMNTGSHNGQKPHLGS